eukprot:3048671-Pyramimonas_sp.AAC.1
MAPSLSLSSRARQVRGMGDLWVTTWRSTTPWSSLSSTTRRNPWALIVCAGGGLADIATAHGWASGRAQPGHGVPHALIRA